MSEKNIGPPGSYEARAMQTVDWGESRNGSAQIGLTFVITTEGAQKGRRLPWFGVLAKGSEAMRITFEALEAAGLPRHEIDPESDHQPKLGSVESVIVVQHKTLQTYENGVLVDKLDENGNAQTIAEIAYVNRLGGARFKTKLSPAKRADLKSWIAAATRGASDNEPPPF